MKNFFITFLCIMAFTSCQKTNQEKAENLLTTLEKTDPDVKKIEFGTLEKARLDYELTLPAYRLREEMRRNVEMMKEKQDFINRWKDINPAGLEDDIKEAMERAKYVKLLNDSFELEKKRFHPDTTRYMMDVRIHHVNHKTNNVEISNGTFFFDKDVSRVVGGIGPMNNDNEEIIYLEFDRDLSHP